jgi:dUTP pyrophosphatase
MVIVKFKKLTDDVRMPIKGSSHAACYDVHAHSIVHKDNGKVAVGLGFKTEIPKGYRGVIVPRSNLTKFHWMLNNSFGVIDADYRGEWMAIFTQIPVLIGDVVSTTAFPYAVGDRVAQIYFEPVHEVILGIVDELEDSERGEGGFGSTGVK